MYLKKYLPYELLYLKSNFHFIYLGQNYLTLSDLHTSTQPYIGKQPDNMLEMITLK